MRSLFTSVRAYVGNRRRARHYRVRLNMSVKFAHTPHNTHRDSALDGYTYDLSQGGISFIVPAIRIGNDYLTGDNRRLHIVLELPAARQISFQAVAVRYHQIEANDGGGNNDGRKNYLVGARIAKIDEDTSRILTDFLKQL